MIFKDLFVYLLIKIIIMELTPKQKAEELVEIFSDLEDGEMYIGKAKQCALISVDLRLDGDFIFTSIEYGEDSLEYWEKVKEELLKIY